jgi:hypothetical protein
MSRFRTTRAAISGSIGDAMRGKGCGVAETAHPKLALHHLGYFFVVVLVLVVGCASHKNGESSDAALTRLRRAVATGDGLRTYRVDGELRQNGDSLKWRGVVVGRDEAYISDINGLLIESRRIGGVSWGRKVGSSEPWIQAPSDGSINMGVLLEGTDVHSQRQGDDWLVTLRFAGIDVLGALSHIPSTGPSDVGVTIRGDLITHVSVILRANAMAELSLSDYGAALVIEPVQQTATTR